jgi:hypothetical protein
MRKKYQEFRKKNDGYEAAMCELTFLIANIEKENEENGWNNKDDRCLSDSGFCPTLGSLRRMKRGFSAGKPL